MDVPKGAIILADAAELFDVGKHTIRNLIKAGELRGFGLRIFPHILLDDLAQYLDRHTIAPQQGVEAMEIPEGLISLREAARRLGVGPKSVRNLIETGELRAFRVRAVIRISPLDLRRYLKSHPASDSGSRAGGDDRESFRGASTW